MGSVNSTIAYRTCPLCEASCGLAISITDGRVGVIRGDRDDVLSAGFICPKGTQLGNLHDDPDRLRRPMVRRDGELVEVDWDEAFAAVEEGLAPILAEYGRDACGIYLGNPSVHNLATQLTNGALITALGSRNRFSASTVDQRPKELSAALMFGSVMVPVPDLDRTDYLLMLGANPRASNGSLCTAPNFPGRLDAIRARGGKVVVVDPRRTETARHADEHLAILPGGDALFLAAIANRLISNAGTAAAAIGRLATYCNSLEDLEQLLAPFTSTAVATRCGIDAADIERVADELASAPTAAVYGRIGTCTQEFGTAASWLVDVVNLLSGNLDRVGGAMFAAGATGQPSTSGAPRVGKGVRTGRVVSRVSGQPETFGEFSVSVLAEEIETPGDGQIRAMIVVAGNPVSSCPNSNRLDAAFASLEFVVSVDMYVNETSRHADVILPPPSSLQKPHYDIALMNFAVRNVANYSPPVLDLEEGELDEWDMMLRLIAILSGESSQADLAPIENALLDRILNRATRDEHGPVHGRDLDDLHKVLETHSGPDRLLDAMLRVGPYGDGFGEKTDGLTLDRLKAAPHGVDLGALQPDRLPDALRTPSGKIELVPDPLRADMPRLEALLGERASDELLLIGRRDLRSNNSWMHNMRVLMKGKHRCTMQLHPVDAARAGLTDQGHAIVRSRVGQVKVMVEVTEDVRPGVVSIPHGFGQNLPGVRLGVASEYPGINTNVLTDDAAVDPVSGNVALTGLPVTVTAC